LRVMALTQLSISSEFVVAAELLVCEHLSLGKMRLQMYSPELPVQSRNPLHEVIKPGRGYLLALEKAVQFPLLLNNSPSQRDGFSLHVIKNYFGLLSLLCRQVQLLSHSKNVAWAGVVVQLCSLRQTHTAAVQELLNLFRQERLHLITGIIGLLRESKSGKEKTQNRNPNTHNSPSPLKCYPEKRSNEG
jgi:hypothetical protein